MLDPVGDDRVARRWGPLVVALGTVVAAAAFVWAVGSTGDAEVSVEETSTTTQPQERDGGDGRGTFPAPIALGGPTDGTESVGLPVRADPSAGLVHGQEVTVTGTGFPAGVEVGVVMCAREAGRDHGARGAAACNLGRFAQATSDADGIVEVRFAVSRLVVLDGVELDCASEPGRCLIGMGMLSDYDTSGGVLVDFDPAVPLPDPPTARLSRTTDLVSGEQVRLTVTGLVPGSSAGLEVCDAGIARCGGFGSALPAADAEGVVETELRLWRAFGSYADAAGEAGTVDCAREPCLVVVHGETAGGRAIPPIEVRFDPAFDEPVIPVAEVLGSGPFGPGDSIPIRVTGVDPGWHLDATICGPVGECFGAGGTADAGGVVAIELVLPGADRFEPCECLLVFGAYQEGPTTGDERPALLPDPLTVTLVG